MTLVYSKEEVKNNLVQLFNDFDWDHSSQTAVDFYANGMEEKSESIKKLFDGTDGRIVVNPDDYAEYLSITAKEELRSYLENHFMNDAYYNVRNENCLNSDFLRDVRFSFINLIDNLDWDSAGKVEVPTKAIPFGGQKFTKVLNTIFDTLVVSKNSLGYNLNANSSDEQKTKINYFKNNIIGGKIASIISSSKSKKGFGKYLIISIRPEDLYTISVGNSWRSCMHPDEGEYNTGALGYIAGKETMVAYLVDAKSYDEDGGRGTVPKIWREMLFLSKSKLDNEEVEFLISQKGYPKKNTAYSNIASDTVFNFLGWEKSESVKDCVEEIIPASGRHYGYVDVFHGSVYHQIEAIHVKKEDFDGRFDDIVIEANVQSNLICLECGTTVSCPSDMNGLCLDCESGGIGCPLTGDWISSRELRTGDFIFVNDDRVSESAIDAGLVVLDIYDEWLIADEAVFVDSVDGYVLKEDTIEALDEDGKSIFVFEQEVYLWTSDHMYHTVEESPEKVQEYKENKLKEFENVDSQQILDAVDVIKNYYSSPEENRNQDFFETTIKPVQDLLKKVGLVEEFYRVGSGFEFCWVLCGFNNKQDYLIQHGLSEEVRKNVMEDKFFFHKNNNGVDSDLFKSLSPLV